MPQRFGVLPEEGADDVSDQSLGEVIPPHLLDTMNVVRLANAEFAASGGRGTRYVAVCNVDDGIDSDLPIQVLDAVDGAYLYVAELLDRLSEDSRKWFLTS